MGGSAGNRAIVLGAGMAGLLAARVLADSYAEVLLVERDRLPGTDAPRRRVPQGRHVHGLLARGQQIIEELFPGVTGTLVDDGAAHGDVTGDVRWILDGHPMRQPGSGLQAVSASRPFLERRVRDRVRAIPNVRILERHDAVTLLTDEEHRRVTGVVVTDLEEGATRSLGCDLVVDATGRGSRVPALLTGWGYPQVPEETVKIDLGYTTRHYRIPKVPEDVMGGDLSVHIVATPSSPRGAVCARVDGDRCVVTAYGMNGDHPPTDEQGFLDFLKSLPAPDVYDAVQSGEPVDDLVRYRFPTNLRRRYERMESFPEGLLVVGDAVCSFNPTYAQGMSVAAIGATMLREHVSRPGGPRATEFFADLAARAIEAPWVFAVSTDLARSGVVGTGTRAVVRAQQRAGRVLAAAARHDEVAIAYARVIGLLDPPDALDRPELAALLDPRAAADGATTREMAQVTAQGLTFDVELSGPRDGDAVVLLHGWPHNHRSWTDIVPVLNRAGLRTIAPDQRGYSPGARPKEVEAYALPLLAQDVLGIMDELGVRQAHVVGHDWGAVVAWYLAAKHADRVRTLTAVAFPHLDAYQHAYRVDPEQQRSSSYIHTLTAPDAAESFLADDAAKLRELLSLHDNALKPEQKARYIEFHTRPGVFDASLNWYRAGTLLDGRSDLGEITVPTTFVWSEPDASVSTLAAEKTAEYVTAPYRLVTLTDASHWQPQEVPELVAEEILALIEDRRPLPS